MKALNIVWPFVTLIIFLALALIFYWQDRYTWWRKGLKWQPEDYYGPFS